MPAGYVPAGRLGDRCDDRPVTAVLPIGEHHTHWHLFSTHQLTVNSILIVATLQITRGVQKVRGPTKKENEFYDETRCEGCDIIKTTPDAATSQSVPLLCSGCWLLQKCLLFLQKAATLGREQ